MNVDQLAGRSSAVTVPDFDTEKLDRLLDAAGVDALVATSRHNVLYLAGAYSLFFEYNPAIADEQLLSAITYVKGDLDRAFSIFSPQEADQFQVAAPWTPTVELSSFTTVDTARAVARHLSELGLEDATVGVEGPFVPHRFVSELTRACPHLELVDITGQLNELRAVKRPRELTLLRTAAEKVVDAMSATMLGSASGVTTRELHDRLAEEEGARGLSFEYCVLATGTHPNRSPSSVPWEPRTALSLDSGATYHRYQADLTRMAVSGPPTARMVELLAEVDALQQQIRGAIRPGVTGRALLEDGKRCVAGLPDGERMTFNMHGVGLVRHEAPRFSFEGPGREDPPGLDEPLEADMVLSVETNLLDPEVGLVKLEDIVAVTHSGADGFGDRHRDWTVAHTG